LTTGLHRECAEENRVPPDGSPFYVNQAKPFANFEQRKDNSSPGHGAWCFWKRTLSKKGGSVKIEEGSFWLQHLFHFREINLSLAVFFEFQD
jgi:hypothetical protein